MKLALNKKTLKHLSKSKKTLPEELTPQVAGGRAISKTLTRPDYSCR